MSRRAPLVAAVVALLVYLPSIGGAFLYDDFLILSDWAIRDHRSLGWVLTTHRSRPLLGLTWAVNYAVAGATPWPYHLVNVLIHAGNAALVASLFLWMARRSGRKDPEPSALLGACLFAASPMAAETVAYVSSRSTALATLLGLGSLRLAVDVLERGSRARLAASFVFYVLALATKEEAVAIPILLLLLDFFFIARQSFSDLLKRRAVHLPFLLLPVLGLFGRRAVTGAWLPPPALDPKRFLATQLAVFPLYFVRALVPVDPAFYRGYLPSPWPPDAATLFGWLVTLVLVMVAIAGRKRWPEWSFAVAWLAAGLLPSSSLAALKEMVVDHRAYLGSAGVAFALGGLLWRPGRGAVAVAIVAALGARSLHYERVLADPTRAWEDAVRRAPHAVEAQLALGEAYAARGDPRAETALRRAVSLDPRDARGWTNLGAYLLERDRLPEAVEAMRVAARADPGDARIHDNLGLMLRALGREDEAMAELEAAIASEPPLAQPRITLAAVLIRRGEYDRARKLAEEAGRLVQDAEEDKALWDLRMELDAAEKSRQGAPPR